MEENSKFRVEITGGKSSRKDEEGQVSIPETVSETERQKDNEWGRLY